ncbi:MAG: hypothetical protein ACJ8LM_06240 [Candidatus Udaeobacter sp.]
MASDSAALLRSRTATALVLLAVGLIFPRGAQLYGNTFFATLLLFIGLSMELLYWNKQESGNSLKVNS